jgi:hypothetical protein
MRRQKDKQESKTLLFILETHTVIDVIKSMQWIIKDRQTNMSFQMNRQKVKQDRNTQEKNQRILKDKQADLCFSDRQTDK